MQKPEKESSLLDLFVPLTNTKAIHFIILVGIVVFANCLFNSFVGDDFGQIVNNGLIQSIRNIPLFFVISTFSLNNGISGIYYKPLLSTIYTLIFAVSGPNAFGFHLFQVLLYITNSVLLYLFFKKFLSLKTSFVLSIIFLVHPINEDVASYIANLQDTLFFFFGILALLLATGRKTRVKTFLVYLMLLFSLLSKETGIAFVFIFCVYSFLFQKKQRMKTFLFCLLLLIPYVLLHFYVVGTAFIKVLDFPITRLSLPIRLLNIPKIIAYYLLTFLYPMSLAVNFNWTVTRATLPDFFVPLIIDILFLILLCLMGWVVYYKDQHKFAVYVFFSLWFFIGLILHLQIIPLDATTAAHWFYVSAAGLLGMIGVFFSVLTFKPAIQKLLVVTISAIILMLSIRTIMRNADFKDNLTLTCHDVQVTPTNASLQTSCGASLFRAGYTNLAQTHLEKAVILAPYSELDWYSLGTLLGAEAQLEKNKALLNQSEKDLLIAIKNGPGIPYAYETLGYLYVNYKDPRIAQLFLASAVKKFPYDDKLYLYLAIADEKLGQTDSAQQAITRAYRLSPTDPDVDRFYEAISSKRPVSIENKSL